ncbi:hypothetical protein [Nitrososphaera sp.]|uniref:hypothetical protein n=1 Tax=Nitrososphaera sp. TaxID=1971748 RepID=UPI003176388A
MQKAIAVLALAAVVASMAISGAPAFAQDDEREGFGLTEQEREGEDDDRGSILGSGVAGLVLAGTVAAILGVAGYAGYKVYQIKRKAKPKAA